jgi:hypothetical protein
LWGTAGAASSQARRASSDDRSRVEVVALQLAQHLGGAMVFAGAQHEMQAPQRRRLGGPGTRQPVRAFGEAGGFAERLARRGGLRQAEQA